MKFLFLAALAPFSLFAQSVGEVWSEIGAKGEIINDLDWSVELNNRFGGAGHETFFPQFSVKYKVTKWFKPGIDYRVSFEKDDFTNYQRSNRLMLNARFEKGLDRFETEFRVRYQYEFSRWSRNTGYDYTTDHVIRFKPEVKYDIDNSFFTPYANMEWFCGLNYGERSFYKMRIGLGTDFELDGPHDIGIGYIFDRELQDFTPKKRHILTVSYKYKL